MGVTPSTSSNQQVNDLCFTQCKELVHRLPKEGRGGLDIPVTDLMVDAGNLVLEYRKIILNKQNSGEGLDSTPAQMRLLGQSAGW